MAPAMYLEILSRTADSGVDQNTSALHWFCVNDDLDLLDAIISTNVNLFATEAMVTALCLISIAQP